MDLAGPDYVVLVVDDLDRALAFYVDLLGIPLAHRSGSYAQLATGTTRLAFYERAAMADTLAVAIRAPDPAAPGFELGFKVADVDAAYGELVANGVSPVVAPTTRSWGQRTAYVRDPDAHLVELVQDLDAATWEVREGRALRLAGTHEIDGSAQGAPTPVLGHFQHT